MFDKSAEGRYFYNMQKVERIKSLELLRAVAFIGVFLTHVGIKELEILGGFSVTLFFILSGFVTTIKENIIDQDSSLINCYKYMKKKIAKIYPLHIITTFLMLPFLFVGLGKESIKTAFIKLVLNALLIQEWFPFGEMSINGVSWFLCTIVFANFVFLKIRYKYIF